MRNHRQRVQRGIEDALSGFPALSFQVDAGSRTIIVTVWPLSALTCDAMSRLQDAMSEEGNSDFDFELLLGEGEPWWYSC